MPRTDDLIGDDPFGTDAKPVRSGHRITVHDIAELAGGTHGLWVELQPSQWFRPKGWFGLTAGHWLRKSRAPFRKTMILCSEMMGSPRIGEPEKIGKLEVVDAPLPGIRSLYDVAAYRASAARYVATFPEDHFQAFQAVECSAVQIEQRSRSASLQVKIIVSPDYVIDAELKNRGGGHIRDGDTGEVLYKYEVVYDVCAVGSSEKCMFNTRGAIALAHFGDAWYFLGIVLGVTSQSGEKRQSFTVLPMDLVLKALKKAGYTSDLEIISLDDLP